MDFLSPQLGLRGREFIYFVKKNLLILINILHSKTNIFTELFVFLDRK